MLINTTIIKALDPCKSRLDNYLEHYSDFSGDLAAFFALDKLTHSDKLWVVLRLLPRFEVEVFAIDCAFAAANAAYAADYVAADNYTAADYADYANAAAYAAANTAYAAANTAYSAANVAAKAELIEQGRQLDALFWLSENITKESKNV